MSRRCFVSKQGLLLVPAAVLVVAALGAQTARAQDNTLYGNNVMTSGSGMSNSLFGENIMVDNTSGCHNTVAGLDAMEANTSGSYDTADGLQALLANTEGNNNTAIGYNALSANTTGNYNIALGQTAGQNITTTSNNIDIGNPGQAGDSGVIRIGTQNVNNGVFVYGIANAALSSGTPVVFAKNGRLGFLASSVRYKTGIKNMGGASDKLMQLRPVTFRYKNDDTGAIQYGLIAEEVEKVYPNLVIRDEDGKPKTVAYQELPAMLLNEVQKQERENRQLASRLAQKDQQIVALQHEVGVLAQKVTQIDALTARLNGTSQQAKFSPAPAAQLSRSHS